MWSYFQRINVLSIPGVDHTRLNKNFRACGITYTLREFNPAKKTVNDGTNVNMGDILSHNHCDETCVNICQNQLTLINDAYNDGLENILIFEDDASFDIPFDKEKLARIITWLSSNEWDLFYFGQCPWPLPLALPVTRDIVRSFSPLTAHSYSLSRKGMHKFLTYMKDREYTHLDRLLRDSPLQKYSSFLSMCFQDKDPGLYRKAQEKFPLPMSFRTVTTLLEWISVIIPLVVITAIVITLYRITKKAIK
jgi:hypothetical protein